VAETWPDPIVKSEHVAQAIDWVRHRTRDRIRLLVAVGANSIAVAKPRDVDAEDAISFLADLQEDIARAIREMQQKRLTHISIRLPDR
jgi:prefoldin subunit 5